MNGVSFSQGVGPQSGAYQGQYPQTPPTLTGIQYTYGFEYLTSGDCLWIVIKVK